MWCFRPEAGWLARPRGSLTLCDRSGHALCNGLRWRGRWFSPTVPAGTPVPNQLDWDIRASALTDKLEPLRKRSSIKMLATAIRNIITSVCCLFVSWLVCRRVYAFPHNFWCRSGKKGTDPINFINFSGNKAKKQAYSVGWLWLSTISCRSLIILVSLSYG